MYFKDRGKGSHLQQNSPDISSDLLGSYFGLPFTRIAGHRARRRPGEDPAALFPAQVGRVAVKRLSPCRLLYSVLTCPININTKCLEFQINLFFSNNSFGERGMGTRPRLRGRLRPK